MNVLSSPSYQGKLVVEVRHDREYRYKIDEFAQLFVTAMCCGCGGSLGLKYSSMASNCMRGGAGLLQTTRLAFAQPPGCSASSLQKLRWA